MDPAAKPKPATIGILMLDTRFPRIPGDIGNRETWPFPVIYKTVKNASPRGAVLENADGLLEPFIAAAGQLVAEGASGITTSCGFLSLFQRELAAAVPVPVVTSSLMQVAMVNATLPAGTRAGILTISKETLTPRHLALAGVPQGTPIGATDPECEFNRAILNDRPDMNIAEALRNNIDAAKRLHQAHPNLGAIVLECTNMPPYAAAITTATGLPVYSIYDLVVWFQAGLRPRGLGERD